MKNSTIWISRLLVGSLFIISGIIKANDPLGFSYKLEEYFAEDVLNWVWFQGWEVGLAIFVSVVEIVLGVAILAAEKAKLATWSLLLMMIFFLLLTGYTAIGNWFFENPNAAFTTSMEGTFNFDARDDIHYFKDCGCFGDAFEFTPIQSFLKDLVLMVFVLILFLKKSNIEPGSATDDIRMYTVSTFLIALFSIGVMDWYFPVGFAIFLFVLMLVLKGKAKEMEWRPWAMAGTTFAICGFFAIHCYAHLPIKDFRAYAIGKNLEQGMMSAEEMGKEPTKYGYFYTMRHVNTGEDVQITDAEYMNDKWWENKDYEMDPEKTEQYLVQKGYEPPIHDFLMTDLESGDDQIYSVLSEAYALMVVCYDLDKTTKDNMEDVAALTEQMSGIGVRALGLSSAGYDDIETFRHEYGLAFPFYTGDATTYKTIVRANPGLVLLKEGTVIGKWHHNDVPSIEDIQNLMD